MLTVKGDSNYSLHLNHNTVDPRQLWVREEDAARGGFFLRNPFLDRCLRAGSSQGGTITMASKSMGDAEFIWRKEQGDDWGCLNKLSDWEQKMNVAGNGPYDENTPIIQYEYDRGSDHELWKLVKYDPNFGPAVIIYEEGGQHLTLGGSDHSRRDEPRQPLLDCPVKLDCDLAYNHAENRDPFGQRYHTEYLVAHPDLWRQVRYRQGLRGQRERFGNRDAVDHASNRRPVFSQRYDISASANVIVEPGKNYNVSLMARHCTLTMPYTATITRRAIDGKPGASYTISGIYRFENAYRYDIVVADADNGAKVSQAVSSPTIQKKMRGT